MIDLDVSYVNYSDTMIVTMYNRVQIRYTVNYIDVYIIISPILYYAYVLGKDGQKSWMFINLHNNYYGPKWSHNCVCYWLNDRIITGGEWDEHNYAEITGRELVEVRKYHDEILQCSKCKK
jgi:hypothetical protein